jgi:hypothetical protein
MNQGYLLRRSRTTRRGGVWVRFCGAVVIQGAVLCWLPGLLVGEAGWSLDTASALGLVALGALAVGLGGWLSRGVETASPLPATLREPQDTAAIAMASTTLPGG